MHIYGLQLQNTFGIKTYKHHVIMKNKTDFKYLIYVCHDLKSQIHIVVKEMHLLVHQLFLWKKKKKTS